MFDIGGLMGAPLDCQFCPELAKCRTQVVNSSGPSDAKIAFIGEGPGRDEDRQGRPFIGKAGKVLRILEWAVGINQHQAYYANATRCFGQRTPKPPEIDACHNYLIEEMRELNPAVIVALGGPAIRSLYRPGVGVREVMGFTLYNDELPGIPIIPTYHPSYIMRGNWGEVALVLKHLRKAKHIVDTGGIEEKYGSYIGITTLKHLRALRDWLLGPEVDLIAVDTETTGLSWMDDELLCISLSPEPGIGYSVPILSRHEREVFTVKAKTTTQKTEYYPAPFWDMDTEMPEAIAILDEILRSDKPKGGQNIGFDIRMLERSTDEQVVTAMTAFGFHVNNVTEDTRLRASLVSEATPANLTLLTALYTDIPYYEAGVSKMKAKMWEVPDEELWEYGGADVDVVQTLLPVLAPVMEEEQTSWVYENISIPLIRCATKLEERGVYIDREHLAKLCSYYSDRLTEEKEKLNELVGREIETPSYYQTVQELVFKEWGLPLTATPVDSARKECAKCRKQQAPCSAKHAKTGADELVELNQRAPHEGLSVLVEIRHLEKFKGTYMDGKDGEGGFLFHLREDGRIHARWNSARASTGRFSCEYPNLMNPPKDVQIHDPKYGLDSDDAVRDMFCAPPGYALLNADWSQAELWVMAYETQDETMLGLLESGTDIHAYVSRELCKLGVSTKFPANCVDDDLTLPEWSKAHKDIRDDGKVFVFGINYGLTEEGAAQRLGCTREEAAPLLAHYVQTIFPGLGAYFNRIRTEMYNSSSTSNKFGRRGHFPEIPILSALRYRGDLEGSVRVGFNMPIQSGAHDLHSLAHIATEAELSSWVEPVVEMHDSLMSYTPLDRLSEAGAAVKELWEGIAHDTVLASGERLNWNIPVDVRGGQSFGSLVSV